MHHFKSQYLCVVALLSLTITCQAADSKPAFSSPSAWVKPISELAAPNHGTNAVAEGISYALMDRQLNVATAEDFTRTVKDLVTKAGMQEGARLTFSFDPDYQSLTIHHIRLTRGSNTMDRLDPKQVRVIQREEDLERHIYDGSLSAVVFLEDVRVGDRLDVAYTIRGRNPIFERKFVEAAYLGWGVPISRNRVRVLVPAGRNIAWKSYAGEHAPSVAETEAGRELVWDLQDQPAGQAEDSMPTWEDVYPWVQLSEFATWQELSRWAVGLYPKDGQQLPEELVQRIEAWKESSSSPEQRLEKALDFVQEEIRYLGFEFGTGSHRPRLPAQVFNTRFGDCKDKTLLLCAILQRMKMDAWPVLVHSSYKAQVNNMLPSPYSFDHVITAVQTPSGLLHVDPTRSYQMGPVSQRHLPDYGCGLPVRTDTYSIARFTAPSLEGPFLDTRESFFVTGRTNPARLEIHTTYTGPEAERYRRILEQNREEELQTQYLNYYAQSYPGVRVKEPLKVLQSTNRNKIETFEYYLITNFWVLNDSKSQYTADFYPSSISSRLDTPEVTIRKTPLALDFPVHEHVRVEVNLPEEWPIKADTNSYTSAAFQFTGKQWFRGRTFFMDYEYKSLTNVVTVADVPLHLKKMRELQDELGYTLYWDVDTTGLSLARVNWPILALGLVSAILLSLGGLWLYRYDPPVRAARPPKPGEVPMQVQGIGGWLILVCIGLILSGPALLFQFWQNLAAYSLPNWHAVTTPGQPSYHPMYAPTLIFELVANIGMFALAMLMIVLFFQERTSFPRLFIVFLAAKAAVLILDTAMAASLQPSNPPGAHKDVAQAVIGCCIWIPYMLVSRRVALTFVSRRETKPAAVPPPIPVAQPAREEANETARILNR